MDCEECAGWMDYLPRLNAYKCRECYEYVDGPPKHWPKEPAGMNCKDCRHEPSGHCSAHLQT